MHRSLFTDQYFVSLLYCTLNKKFNILFYTNKLWSFEHIAYFLGSNDVIRTSLQMLHSSSKGRFTWLSEHTLYVYFIEKGLQNFLNGGKRISKADGEL